MPQLASAQSDQCAANCKTCWDTAATNCMSCDPGYILDDFQCKTTGTACQLGYTLDVNDNICKRTKFKIDNPCEPNTFNKYPGADQVSQCVDCTVGKDCDVFGLPAESRTCQAGHYCTGSSSLRSPVAGYATDTPDSGGTNFYEAAQGDVCPTGSYCLTGSREGTKCAGGLYCPDIWMKTGTETPGGESGLECLGGFYCSAGSHTPTPDNPLFAATPDEIGGICQPGKYCPKPSTIQLTCSTGTFLPYEGASVDTECINCIIGQYCDTPGLGAVSGPCDAGYFCDAGSSSPRQTRCYQDFFCPSGTTSMKTCAPGTYTVGTGSISCINCNDGFTCAGTGGQTSCDAGYYCINDRKIPCPSGTESTAIQQADDTQCAACEAGYACKQPAVKTKCSPGFICDQTGSEVETPNHSSQGGRVCVPGEICPVQSSVATQCQQGFYCTNYAKQSQTGSCQPGYYCPAGSQSPLAVECPLGNYCPKGASAPQPCPAGTYLDATKAVAQTECKDCPSDVICADPGQGMQPTTDCDAGFYCESGSDSATAKPCPKGYKCPAITKHRVYCEAGTYQDTEQQSDCKQCPAGSYCDGRDSTNFKTCPRGYYCPAGTRWSEEFPCAAGSYNDLSGKALSTDCKQCDAGYYCQFEGQTAQLTKILPRYHANGVTGATKPDPYLCPHFHYCPEGSFDAVVCPDGTWTAWLGGEKNSDCIPCERGKYCKFATMAADGALGAGNGLYTTFKGTNPSFVTTDWYAAAAAGSTATENFINLYFNDCNAGYICLEGAIRPDPADVETDNGYPCPIGHYCEPGDIIEQPCAPGTYNAVTQQGACLACEEGKYCPDFAMTDGLPCLEGYYCPGGDIFPIPCKAGTYNSPASATLQTECLLCPDTFYCSIAGQLETTDKCDAGFICKEGENARPGPYSIVYDGTTSGRCPTGSYCGSGDLTFTPCAPGTYQDKTQGSECLKCPPGYYCVGGNTGKVPCQEGFFCSLNSDKDDPTDGILGDECPVGYYCPTGTGQPLPCLDGYRNEETGKALCDACPEGYLCKSGVTETCPDYHYCDGDASFQFGKLCPSGTFAEAGIVGQTGDYNCTICGPSEFCLASRIVGKCAPGYICLEGADSHTPDLDEKAYACPLGYYCEEGEDAPVLCPIGTFTFETGGKQVSECTTCLSGFYCNYDEIEPQECPKGTYCPFNSLDPTSCPRGTFNPYVKGEFLNDCLPCRGGYTCSDEGLGSLFSYGDTYKCPLGSYCPRGENIKPIPCIAGSYLDDRVKPKGQTFEETYLGATGQADNIKDCSLCPEHFYCEKGNGDRYTNPCPSGSICPPGSGEPQKCPPGFYCKRSGLRVEQLICPEGFYCPIGTETPHKCGPGDVCSAGSSSPAIRGATPEDCEPGEYLNVDKCIPCEPGFVCELHTSQKYPIDLNSEGGYECPPGHYCPRGTRIKDIQKCPVGTFRLTKRGETIQDCSPCPDGSAADKEASTVCLLCGRGATHSADRSYCECVGAFRTWQGTTNSCVCSKGYFDPYLTEETQTSTANLDCQPLLKPICGPLQFINKNNECQRKNSCYADELCNGQGETEGYYDDALDGCFCRNVVSEPEVYCDATCEYESLKAYYTQEGKIQLVAGDKSRTFAIDLFSQDLLLEGLSCPIYRCQIVSLKNNEGTMVSTSEALEVFQEVWKEKVDPNYSSPYTTVARRLTYDSEIPEATYFNVTRVNSTRFLQGGSTEMVSSIQCIVPYDSMSFEVSENNFPVYITQSIYNTDANYDYGLFTNLQTKLRSAQLSITTFVVSFTYEGVFVFGDYANPTDVQTIVLVTAEAGRCPAARYPLTAENLKLLKIEPQLRQMKVFGAWLHIIPPFFICVAFGAIYLQNYLEKRQEAFELERRLKYENNMNLKKYFKKKQDRFDKIDYLGDLYKLIQTNLAQIKAEISENDRRTEEEERDNMNKMLKDKHSLLTALEKGKSKDDLDEIRNHLQDMLDNLRSSDGRSLREILEQMQRQKLLEEEEARLREIEAQEAAAESEESSVMEEVQESKSVDSFQEDYGVEESKQEDESEDDAITANPQMYADLVKAKEDFKNKREDFAKSLGDDLTDEERKALLANFDAQQKEMERQLQREQEDQDAALKARLAQRNRQQKKAASAVNDATKEKEEQIKEILSQIQEVTNERDDIDMQGINTKDMKREREREVKEKMKEYDRERDAKLAQVREDYLARIANARTAAEKERLLEEMGRRLKTVEDQLADEKKRQESHLKKMLAQRQKKDLKTEVKTMNKQIDNLEEEIEKLKDEVDEEKAKVYAEEGAQGLVDEDIQKRKEKISGAAQTDFDTNLNKQEQDDMEIHVAQLEIEKEKELKQADGEVERELDNELGGNTEELEAEKEKLRKQIQGASSKEERDALLEQLKRVEKAMQHELDQEKRQQDKMLEERRKRKAHAMQLKKMRIELKQLSEINDKEIELNQDKFDKQIEEIEKKSSKDLDKETRVLMNHTGPGKERALVLINETGDDLLAKKLKILMSKQFFDLSKYLGTLQQSTAMDQVIRNKDVQFKFELEKEKAIQQGMSGNDLEDLIYKIGAQRDLELKFVEDALKAETKQKESDLRAAQEEKFAEERKALITRNTQIKRAKLLDAMKKCPDDATVQEIGQKLLKRIDASLQEEMAIVDKEKEERLEKARMRIIAESEDELKAMQNNLNDAMKKEEEKLDEQLSKRKEQIMSMKRQNLDDRLKMVAGEMSDLQIKEMREQYNREFNNLEAAIRSEKEKQLVKMRSAMLSRRIAKEKRRKEDEKAKEQLRERERVKRMNGGMAKAFRDMIKKKQGGVDLMKRSSIIGGTDKLRTKLIAWNRTVDDVREVRGGEANQVWNLQSLKDLEMAEKAKLEAEKAAEEAAKRAGMEYTIQELFKRILKVENLSHKIRDFGGNVNLLQSVDSIDVLGSVLGRGLTKKTIS